MSEKTTVSYISWNLMTSTTSKEMNICKHCQCNYPPSLDKSSCRRNGYCSKECSLLPVFEQTTEITSRITDKLARTIISPKENTISNLKDSQRPVIPHYIPPKTISPLPPPRQIPTLVELCNKMLVQNSTAITDLSGLDAYTGTCLLKEVNNVIKPRIFL